MASLHTIPITPTPASVTQARAVRTDDRQIPVEQAVDMAPETRKLPDAPIDKALSDIRPVIERLDGAKDVAETLEVEVRDQDDRAMQANDAYQTLRQPDEEKTSVGTA
ncbi:hypothetical protein GCM10009069_24360 [Algimonas arctica]|uniref:Uncharacterized protein n=1 Tax=Algimonas arctica TaxID=1479486 RepID=A0A8J3CTT4_9PROT|nr:hypothetical protein [Algimonas arctica]GHB00623.1 hypothetical protein GCM10009069_24360 [Algimonas arctica]